jgi:aminopeptidase N
VLRKSWALAASARVPDAGHYAGGNFTTPDFIALAERESGRDLSGSFRVWLYREGKPQSW